MAGALFQSDLNRTQLDRVVAEADKSTVILSSLPDDLDVPNPWSQAAAFHLVKGQYAEAARLALRSIAIEQASRAAYDRRHAITTPIPAAAADAFRTLASAYLSMSQPERALAAAVQAQTINPADVAVYGELADAYLAQNLGEDAAIALAQGMFATGDSSLRADLLKLYQSGVDTKGCAVVSGPRGPALNPSCEIVLRDLCIGTTRARRPDLRRQLPCRD